MKKVILIISSVLFFSSSTELHELIRLPLLLEHYYQHRSNNPNLSLFNFLKIHYSGNHPNDNDDKDDTELPFKSKGNLIHIDTPIPHYVHSDEKLVFPLTRKLIFQYTEDIPDNKSFAIFHPPRFA